MSPNKSLSLQALQDELNQWRSTRTSRHIPPQIKARAIALLEEHKVSAVIDALGINSKMLKQWQQQLLPSERAEPNFISLPDISSCDDSHESINLALKISISSSEGSALSLEGNLSLDHWHSAVSLFNSWEKQA